MNINNLTTGARSSRGLVDSRAHNRFTPAQAEVIVAQKNWEHFAQLGLVGDTVIIGQILDISNGGINLKMSYHFDIVDSIPAKLTLSVRKEDSDLFAYDVFEINASLIRCERIDDAFSKVALMFAPEDEEREFQITRLIEQIR